METKIRTRQFGIRDIFTEGWQVFRPNWLTISLIVLCICAPIEVVTLLLQFNPWIRLIAYSYLVPIMWVAIAFVVENSVQGQHVTWGDAVRYGLSRWPRVIFTLQVGGFILLGLSLLLIVPGVIWYVYYIFNYCVAGLRNISGKKALDYSKNLVQGQWWRVTGIWLLLFALQVGLYLVVSLPFAIVAVASGIQAFQMVANILGDLVIAFFTALTVVWFLNTDYLKNPERRRDHIQPLKVSKQKRFNPKRKRLYGMSLTSPLSADRAVALSPTLIPPPTGTERA